MTKTPRLSAIVVAMTGIMALSHASTSFGGDIKFPYQTPNVCPVDNCRYGEWTANEAVAAYNSTTNTAKHVFWIAKGEKVKATSGVVNVHKPGSVETLKSVLVGFDKVSGKGPLLSLPMGEKIQTLHYLGDGNTLFWYKGKFYVDKVETGGTSAGYYILEKPVAYWWVKVRNSKNKEGWVFDSQKFSW